MLTQIIHCQLSIVNYLETYPYHIAAIIALIVLLAMALLFPAKLVLFRVKFNYTKDNTLMQFKKRPNLLARIFFYSKPSIVIYIGKGRRWFTFKNMGPHKQITSQRMKTFLWREEEREYTIYRKRTVKKERA